jgi:hypothetical protein
MLRTGQQISAPDMGTGKPAVAAEGDSRRDLTSIHVVDVGRIDCAVVAGGSTPDCARSGEPVRGVVSRVLSLPGLPSGSANRAYLEPRLDSQVSRAPVIAPDEPSGRSLTSAVGGRA